jgi:uncharacterized membrane protein YhdT
LGGAGAAQTGEGIMSLQMLACAHILLPLLFGWLLYRVSKLIYR